MFDKDKFQNIKARLKSFRCSVCDGWFTSPEKRPYTTTIETSMCSCSKGIHNSLVPDVNEEDVEWLVEQFERLKR